MTARLSCRNTTKTNVFRSSCNYLSTPDQQDHMQSTHPEPSDHRLFPSNSPGSIDPGGCSSLPMIHSSLQDLRTNTCSPLRGQSSPSHRTEKRRQKSHKHGRTVLLYAGDCRDRNCHEKDQGKSRTSRLETLLALRSGSWNSSEGWSRFTKRGASQNETSHAFLEGARKCEEKHDTVKEIPMIQMCCLLLTVVVFPSCES